MRVGIYIDGFNVFYGLKRFEPDRNYRWLDLYRLAERLRPGNEISIVRYFTARIHSRGDPVSPVRQDVYNQALKTHAPLMVHEGEFRTDKRRMPLVNAPNPENSVVDVWRTEEKGSLAADGFLGRYDMAVLITNDSDLIEPIRLVQDELGFEVGVYNPQERFSGRLNRIAAFYVQISEADFAASQFPDVVIDQNGRTITRPAAWNVADETV